MDPAYPAVGVAIAISLVPPLAVTGLLVNVHRYHDAGRSALLFATNVAAIVATGTIVFLAYRVRTAAEAAGIAVGRLRGPTLAAVAVLVVLVAGPAHLRHVRGHPVRGSRRERDTDRRPLGAGRLLAGHQRRGAWRVGARHRARPSTRTGGRRATPSARSSGDCRRRSADSARGGHDQQLPARGRRVQAGGRGIVLTALVTTNHRYLSTDRLNTALRRQRGGGGSLESYWFLRGTPSGGLCGRAVVRRGP